MTILESEINKTSVDDTIQRGDGSSGAGDRYQPGTTPTGGRVSQSGVAGEVKVQSPEGSDLASPLGSYRLIRQKLKGDSNNLLPSVRIRRFQHYLSEKKGSKFNLWGMAVRGDELEDINTTIPYVHRWTEIYRKKNLAKLYLLDTWHTCHKTPLCMVTFTTYQSGPHSVEVKGHKVSREESFRILKDGWAKLSRVLRYQLGSFRYCIVMEPHKTGYPHYHVLIFKEISVDLQERIRTLWSDKYGAGSREHGVDFSIKNLDGIKSVKNYLMKYLHKSFEYDNNRNYLMFNTIVWENRYRVFMCDRQLSRVMSRPGRDDSCVTWLSTELENSFGETREIWKNPSLVVKNES